MAYKAKSLSLESITLYSLNSKQSFCLIGASQVVLVVKNLPVNAGDIRDTGLIPASGGGHGNPPQDFCLENAVDRETWQAGNPGNPVHRVAKSQTQLKGCSMHTHTHSLFFEFILSNYFCSFLYFSPHRFNYSRNMALVYMDTFWKQQILQHTKLYI